MSTALPLTTKTISSETCFGVIRREIERSGDQVLPLLFQCAKQLPHKIPLCGTLIGLLNLENEDFVRRMVESVQVDFQYMKEHLIRGREWEEVYHVIYLKFQNHVKLSFAYEELSRATYGFNRELKIGEGGFGSVYKGKILTTGGADSDPPLVVAIKKLNRQGLQGHKQWLAEVQFLGVVNHQNVVKLIGYCSEDGETGIERLLVYEYMSNKSLEDHLFSRGSRTLPWRKRLKVMVGAAEGLAYLHEPKVIYRDFKSSNVLLNDEFCPKLSDFGLAREGPEGDNTHVTTALLGEDGSSNWTWC
ncbi:PREDICTED: probable receptor-like protein kinase At5g47070 [Camelina sativa]|uniref:Probable receptor-like protein kinase At5g47070 n=1 Tax=Camelina sativa TaxID=90675 RepID=A0ABM0YQ47_CAMSA|nr:PREDICTED: probable receptor-like protein kinase At5g47070 [Camelina sativa]XP_010504278.1 PREDICTED: probable receptor-like protein kinase At5g47070 [Camelina sativa]XP_010504279.1 PREDICTED: probable receptor-like protein kinase At5g47070 [Camelina sativa]XP_010504280.1 PREDICTED: probable receptor-like protein kinase At5g47070 [Camelina sativa]